MFFDRFAIRTDRYFLKDARTSVSFSTAKQRLFPHTADQLCSGFTCISSECLFPNFNRAPFYNDATPNQTRIPTRLLNPRFTSTSYVVLNHNFN